MKNIYVFCFLILCPMLIYAQPLQVDSNISDLELVQSLIGTGVSISNINITGAEGSYGHFENGGMGLSEGVLLTSGSITNALGPNDFLNASTANSTPGSALLDEATGLTTYDACSISFDFVPTGTTLTFNYIFASEEYHEYVNSNYNDAMGLFISGPSLALTNIALVPNSTDPVTINNINGGEPGPNPPNQNPDCASGENASNPQFFVDNCEGNNIEYDGRTIPLTASIENLIACETYSMTLVIADAGDYYYDSGLFIAQGTFSSDGSDVNDVDFFLAHQDGTPDNEFRICEDVYLDKSGSTIQSGLHSLRLAIVDPDNNPPADPDNDVTVIANTSWSQDPGGPTWLNATQIFEDLPGQINYEVGTIYQIRLGIFHPETCGWNYEYRQFTLYDPDYSIDFFFAHQDGTPDDEFIICEDVYLDASGSNFDTEVHYLRLSRIDDVVNYNPAFPEDNTYRTTLTNTIGWWVENPNWSFINISQIFQDPSQVYDPVVFVPGTTYQVKLGINPLNCGGLYEYHTFTYFGTGDCEINEDLNACIDEGKTGHIGIDCPNPNTTFNWSLPQGSSGIISPAGNLVYGASEGTYSVTISDECGTNELTFEIESECCSRCIAPSNLYCYAHKGNLFMSWDEVPDVEGYEIIITLNDDECCSNGIPQTLVPIQINDPNITEYIYEIPENIYCLSWYMRSICENGEESEDSQKICNVGLGCEPIRR